MKRKLVILNSPACFSKADAANKLECKGCTWLFDCIERREKKEKKNDK